MANHPPTADIVTALRTLGVEGPAQTVEVLNAANLVLPAEQVAAVMNGVVIARDNEARQDAESPR